jgi:signal transduction histidine kinase
MAGTDLTHTTPAVHGGTPQPQWRHLPATETRERTLLAAAIHDDPMQLIVASMLQIDLLRLNRSIDDEDAWENIIGMLESSVERLRKLIAAITPPDASDGLAEALHELADGIFMGSHTAITVNNRMTIDLAPEREQAAQLIFREALVNAREHAHATSVVLTIEQSDDFLATLTDDGVGGAADIPGGGLTAIRELATSAGGDLRIVSPPGVGTTITLRLKTSQDGASWPA